MQTREQRRDMAEALTRLAERFRRRGKAGQPAEVLTLARQTGPLPEGVVAADELAFVEAAAKPEAWASWAEALARAVHAGLVESIEITRDRPPSGLPEAQIVVAFLAEPAQLLAEDVADDDHDCRRDGCFDEGEEAAVVRKSGWWACAAAGHPAPARFEAGDLSVCSTCGSGMQWVEGAAPERRWSATGLRTLDDRILFEVLQWEHVLTAEFGGMTAEEIRHFMATCLPGLPPALEDVEAALLRLAALGRAKPEPNPPTSHRVEGELVPIPGTTLEFRALGRAAMRRAAMAQALEASPDARPLVTREERPLTPDEAKAAVTRLNRAKDALRTKLSGYTGLVGSAYLLGVVRDFLRDLWKSPADAVDSRVAIPAPGRIEIRVRASAGTADMLQGILSEALPDGYSVEVAVLEGSVAS